VAGRHVPGSWLASSGCHLEGTWADSHRSEESGENLISLGVDHMDFSVSPAVEKKFMLKTLVEAGSPAIPMHLALFNLPLTFAIQFGIPLVVWVKTPPQNTGASITLTQEWSSTLTGSADTGSQGQRQPRIGFRTS